MNTNYIDITLYLGQLAGLYPENPIQAALVDAIMDSTENVLDMANKVRYNKNQQEKKKGMDNFINGEFQSKYWLSKFESRLEENEKRGNKNGYLVGDKITIADLKFKMIMPVLYTELFKDNGGAQLLNKYPRILKWVEIIAANQQIKAFEEKFAKNMTEYKEKNTDSFKYEGKYVS